MQGAHATDITVSSVRLHPVKSLRGYTVDEAIPEERGFRWDRRFMVVTRTGDFVTQRECHTMATVRARIDGEHLTIGVGSEPGVVLPSRLEGFDTIPVRIWNSRVRAGLVSREADEWLSEVLGRDVRLVAMPESTRRGTDPAYDTGNDIVSFADGYPYLGISDSSLASLNDRLAAPVVMERFRPNLTFSGSEPFQEDRWHTIRVGRVVFRVVKACARCVVTTVDPDLGTAGREPLATLSTFRRREDGQVYMGVNLVPKEIPPDVVIRVRDPVVVLKTLPEGRGHAEPDGQDWNGDRSPDPGVETGRT